jgi:hypothetical protein
MTGWSFHARVRGPALLIWVIIIGTACCLLSGCSMLPDDQSSKHPDEEKKTFTIPTVKVPILKFPLTNRSKSDGVLDHFKPPPQALPGSTKW